MDFSFTPDNDSKDPLKDFGRNLTDEAVRNKLDPVIGRDDEIRRVIRILSRKTKNNPVLVGEPGVGKTAIVEGLAQKIVEGNVPENLKDKEIIEIDLPAMIAGASFQGQFEKRLKDLMQAIKDSNGSVIVFIDEIHMLVGTGKNAQGGMDAAQIIKPMLARGEMRLIGATTLDEHRKYIETDSALERRLQKVIVNEPTEEETITILRGIKERLEAYHGVKIHDNALVSAAKLSNRYISDRFLPDKAIDLVDEASAAIQTEMNSKPEQLEKAEQKVMIQKMERAALQKETDSKSKARLAKLVQEIEESEKLANKLKSEWDTEKEDLQKIAQMKTELDDLRAKQSRYQQDGDFENASKLLYKDIPALEKQLSNAEKIASKNENHLLKDNVNEDEIADIVSKWTGIPVSKLVQSQKEKLLTLNKNLEQRVKGQNEALELVANTILRSRADINDPNKPIGSFIFMGPTGVGKTEVARSLAAELFDSEKHMVRIDMSEYMEKHAVSRLIGAPPGYVGYDAGGQLTEAVRRKPYSIVLFDEIEKAHPDVLNVLLQILDDGVVTDGRGKEINFKNTIIIMTTNIGAIEILKGEKNIDLISLLRKYLSPEFINRIDEIISFNSLDEKVIKQIVELELEYLVNRLKEKNITIFFEKSVIEKIAKDSYDPMFGARPIKRYIKKYIESELAKEIISGKLVEGKQYSCSTAMNKFVYTEKKFN